MYHLHFLSHQKSCQNGNYIVMQRRTLHEQNHVQRHFKAFQKYVPHGHGTELRPTSRQLKYLHVSASANQMTQNAKVLHGISLDLI